jgi:glycosyltransferase involved in cell wall biosynthesis
MMGFFAVAHRLDPRWHLLVLTQSHASEAIAAARRAGIPRDAVDVATSAPEDVGYYLAAADAGLSFIRLPRSGAASWPTKVGEYLAAGLPVVATTGMDDCDELLRRRRVGVLVAGDSDSAYENAVGELDRLLADPTTPERCRAAAREELSMTNVGWPRYRTVYGQLLASAHR